jgi:hypothetical protein
MVWMTFVHFCILPHVSFWVSAVTLFVGVVAIVRLDRIAVAEPAPLRPDITLESKV